MQADDPASIPHEDRFLKEPLRVQVIAYSPQGMVVGQVDPREVDAERRPYQVLRWQPGPDEPLGFPVRPDADGVMQPCWLQLDDNLVTTFIF